MKKILILASVLCLAVFGAFAQDMAFSAGAQVGMSFYNLNINDGSVDGGWNLTMFIVGAFVDANYIRVSADFEMALSGQAYVDTIHGDYDSVNVSYINLTLLGKYPFDLGGVKLWPAIGLRYAIAVSYELGGIDLLSASDADLSDFYIVGGIGLDYDMGGLYITIQALYCFNLTANPSTNDLPSGYSANGGDIQISAGVGFGF